MEDFEIEEEEAEESGEEVNDIYCTSSIKKFCILSFKVIYLQLQDCILSRFSYSYKSA